MGSIKNYFKALLLPALLIVSHNAQADPIPSTDLDGLPETHFSGEQYCFDAPISNLGDVGFGPYLRLQLPPELSFDSATFVGSPVSIEQGIFPDSAELEDPVSGDTVTVTGTGTGTAGYSLITLQPPIGSIVNGGPALNINICSTIDNIAPIGGPLTVSLTPVFQFGATATGDTALAGAEVTATVTPTIVEFEKIQLAPEGERPPSTTWPVGYQLVADIANGRTLANLVFKDVLPASLQLTGAVSITGGTGCTSNVDGQTINVSCTEALGTTSNF